MPSGLFSVKVVFPTSISISDCLRGFFLEIALNICDRQAGFKKKKKIIFLPLYLPCFIFWDNFPSCPSKSIFFFFSSLFVLSFSLPCSVLFSFTLYFSSSFSLLSQTYEVLSDCKENCKNFHRRKYYFYNKGSASLLPSPTTAKMFQIHKTAPQCVWKKERFP